MTAIQETAATVRADLEERGFVLEAADGRLWISPAANLTESDREAIKSCRDDLYRLVEAGHTPEPEPTDPAMWQPIACTLCGKPAIRDGRHLCRECVATWHATMRRPVPKIFHQGGDAA